MRRSWLPLLVVGLALAGCQVPDVPVGDEVQPPRLEADAFVAADGYRLPLHHWPAAEARAVVLGLHGLNDYGAGLADLGHGLAAQGITVYAYDQRGFGATAGAGGWPGYPVLVEDARSVLRILRQRHPELPLYLVGSSMGGAIALLALAPDEASDEAVASIAPGDGVVLLAPAVLGPKTLPAWQRAILRFADWLAPALPLSVHVGHAFGVRPTDRPEVIEALRRDPLVPEQVRVATIAGLVELMKAALPAAADVQRPTLLLYGTQDDLVPVAAICDVVGTVLDAGTDDWWRARIYPDGYHLLTRYSGAGRVIGDMAAWILESPTRADVGGPYRLDQVRVRLCDAPAA